MKSKKFGDLLDKVMIYLSLRPNLFDVGIVLSVIGHLILLDLFFEIFGGTLYKSIAGGAVRLIFSLAVYLLEAPPILKTLLCPIVVHYYESIQALLLLPLLAGNILMVVFYFRSVLKGGDCERSKEEIEKEAEER